MAGGDGALAVHVVPRYELRNASSLTLQYKQQGTHAERDLGQDTTRFLHWPDGSLPLRICVRIHEAGALWSGAMSLDTPGDAFVKIRHKCANQFRLSKHCFQAWHDTHQLCVSSLA